MIYYFLLITATLLYALSFYFNKKVEQNCKDNTDTTILFMTVTWAEVFLVLLVILRGQLKFTWFSFVCAVVYAAFLVIYTVLNLKILKTVELSQYSLYTMLGGMLVPTVYGIVFAREGITLGKVLCCLFVTGSLLLDCRDGKTKRGERKFLLAVFFVNGMFGVVSAIHQNSSQPHVGSLEYMSIQALIILICGSIWLSVRKIEAGKIDSVINKRAYAHMLCYGAVYGAAEFILLVALKHVLASVQYPIITGGVIIFSTLISAMMGEKKDRKSVISIALAIAGLLFLLI